MGGSYVTTFLFPLLKLYMSKILHLLLIMNPNESFLDILEFLNFLLKVEDIVCKASISVSIQS